MTDTETDALYKAVWVASRILAALVFLGGLWVIARYMEAGA